MISVLVDDLPLIDHHCHGVARDPLDRAAFEAQLCEAAGPSRWHGSRSTLKSDSPATTGARHC